ncbi:MAG: transglutaminase-like domain-containing protein [Elusimicrobiota bacterium]
MTPPFLLGAGMAFWGWQTDSLLLAVPAALALEGCRSLPARWDVPRQAFHRMADRCSLLFAAAVVYAYSTREAVAAIMWLAETLPAVLFPMILAQSLSTQGRVDLGAFFWSLRGEGGAGYRGDVDVSFPYLALCALAAGAANKPGPGFYSGVVLLAGYALWRHRPAGTSAAAWGVLFSLAAALGYYGHVGLHGLQHTIEVVATDLFFGVIHPEKNPSRTHTAIGSIGTLKQSGRILLRVRPGAGQPAPPLLRNACYDLVKGSEWFARNTEFKDAPRGPAEGSWELGPLREKRWSARISMPLKDGEGLLPLPSGAFLAEDLPAASVALNRLGAARVQYGPSDAEFRVFFEPKASVDAPPGETDLQVPPGQAVWLSPLARRLGLSRERPQDSIRTLLRFFHEEFEYSTDLPEVPKGADPVREFVLNTREGHCEYFATAAVLLLRAAGIPARYATGFSVQELSRLEEAYVVRQRHAHAWTRAFLEGAWMDVDATPPSWAEHDAGQSGFFEPMSDWFSWLRYRFMAWRAGEGSGGKLRLVVFALAALSLWAGWKAYRTVRHAAAPQAAAAARVEARSGMDSEFYRIERMLALSGRGRRPWETQSAWLKRIDQEGALKGLLLLHNRLRFDPRGLSAAERGELRAGVEGWFAGGKKG